MADGAYYRQNKHNRRLLCHIKVKPTGKINNGKQGEENQPVKGAFAEFLFEIGEIFTDRVDHLVLGVFVAYLNQRLVRRADGEYRYAGEREHEI